MCRRYVSSVIVIICVCISGFAVEDQWPEWPSKDDFAAGQNVQFRLPFFKNYYTYPNNEPLFFTLYLSKDYDPTRHYPLCIQYQGQNAAPGHWVMRQAVADEAIILGVSWSMSAPMTAKEMRTRDTGMYHIPACVHWLTTQFLIDRERVIVGGFSAGGWSASSQAMRPQYRHISTHFLITGAGTRGRPVFELFKGRSVFLAAGTKDMNYDWAQKARAQLTNLGFDLTYFEEPEVEHALGPQMKVEMNKWFETFNVASNAQRYYDEAQELLAQKRPDMEAVCMRLADVAKLGDADLLKHKARAQLEELEGEALAMTEAAYEMLKQRKYGLAQNLFKDAGKLAKKKKSLRLIKLCMRGLAEIGEWQFVEQVTLLDQCEFTDRPYQAYLLCQDGVKRLSKPMANFGGELFKNNYDWYEDIMKKMKKPRKQRLSAQKALIGLRLKIWSGKAVKDEKAIDKTRTELEEIMASLDAADPEQRELQELLGQLPAKEQLSLFGM